MNPLAVICMEGVLVEGTDFKASPPTKHGRLLYESLKGQYQLLILSAEPSYENARAWLKREYFTGFGSLFCRPENTIVPPVAWKVGKIREMQAEGWPVALYLDNDPTSIRAAFLEGVPTALIAAPRFARPEWRPDADRSITPWDALVDTMEQEHLLKTPEV